MNNNNKANLYKLSNPHKYMPVYNETDDPAIIDNNISDWKENEKQTRKHRLQRKNFDRMRVK